ncbi:MAG: cytochrome o ubiquinol oxidase subunit IV [Chlamydiae bacterium]|nr:cytochrome o ubiquinol oxidase subunit IV [Chlamydiota bacterium]
MIDRHHGWNVSYKPAILGFIFSLILIAAMYRFAIHHNLSGGAFSWTIFGFGITMALVQLVFFLHIGMESKPHWNVITFAFTVLVIAIVIGGSIWIMNNLDYNLMPRAH